MPPLHKTIISEQEKKSMNYERMWFALKESLINTRMGENNANSLSARMALNRMEEVEIQEAKRVQKSVNAAPYHECACGRREVNNQGTNQTGKANRKPEEFLKDIFGNEMVSDLEELAKRIDAKTDDKVDFIMVDGTMDIPEELEDAAREKGLIFARVEAIKKDSIPFPGIPFPGVMMGSIIGSMVKDMPRKKDPNK